MTERTSFPLSPENLTRKSASTEKAAKMLFDPNGFKRLDKEARIAAGMPDYISRDMADTFLWTVLKADDTDLRVELTNILRPEEGVDAKGSDQVAIANAGESTFVGVAPEWLNEVKSKSSTPVRTA